VCENNEMGDLSNEQKWEFFPTVVETSSQIAARIDGTPPQFSCDFPPFLTGCIKIACTTKKLVKKGGKTGKKSLLFKKRGKPKPGTLFCCFEKKNCNASP